MSGDGPRRAADLPTLGLGGLLSYRGAESAAIERVSRYVLVALAIVFLLFVPAQRRLTGSMALAMLIGSWAWGVSASSLAPPIVLLALGALEEAGDPTG